MSAVINRINHTACNSVSTCLRAVSSITNHTHLFKRCVGFSFRQPVITTSVKTRYYCLRHRNIQSRHFSSSIFRRAQIAQFDPPGGLKELDEVQKKTWSNWVSTQFDNAVKGYPEFFDFDGPRVQFYNPAKTDLASDGAAAKISWVGFPRKVQVAYPSGEKRWQVADGSRDVQDEYCEWNVIKDPTTLKINKVIFSCEGPEYWDFLGRYNPSLLLSLYKKHVGELVKEEDLFGSSPQLDEDGNPICEFQPNNYIRANKWNNDTLNGIMHLIQINNTLGAEIELAGGSSVVRKINGRILTGQKELIKCGRYGGEERNSDPFIGSQVNAFTRRNAFVSLTNPVGLYFDLEAFEPSGWETPDGSDPNLFWRIIRGTKETPVRLEFEVPTEKGFTVGDIKINGKKIIYGGQIADFIHIKLTGFAQNFGKNTSQPLTSCRVRKREHSIADLKKPRYISRGI